MGPCPWSKGEISTGVLFSFPTRNIFCFSHLSRTPVDQTPVKLLAVGDHMEVEFPGREFKEGFLVNNSVF